MSDTNKLTVLVVEDDETTRRGLLRLFGKDPRVGTVLEAVDGLAALGELEARTIDIVVSDEVMPRINGLRLLETIHSRWPATRRVLFTGEVNTKLVIAAVNRGGVDKVLEKGIPPEELRSELAEVIDSCFKGRMEPASSPVELPTDGELEDAARVIVAADELAIRSALVNTLGEAKFHATPTSVGGLSAVLSDRIDAVIVDLSLPSISISQILGEVRRVVLDCPVIVLVRRGQVGKAHDALQLGAFRYLVHPIDRAALVSTVSKATSIRRLATLRRGASLASSPTDQLASLRSSFDRALRELFVVYQPIVRYSDRSLFGYEALVRSREPTLPHPGALFDAAEKLGRTIDVGVGVRRRAPAPFQTNDHPLLFVNLHVEDVMCADLLDSPLANMSERVVLEITERASINDVVGFPARLMPLRAKGYRIAIDDLGAGYAGLSSFVQLDPDIVKLDMSLVRGIHDSKTKQRLVAGLTESCADLGIQMIAEGVETAEELAALISAGCDLFQGYFFARPSESFGEIRWE